MSKVFISSTVYDLLDIRSELEILIQEMEFTPVLSDSYNSGFKIETNENSIETCLINVRKCDYFLVILDQRYGPRLGSVGFEDVSATHLEYLEAKKNKIPIYMFVRDRLLADYSTWKKNKGQAFKSVWTNEKESQGLFDLINSHQKLSDKNQGNWFQTFKNSVELKGMIKSNFAYKARRNQLVNLIENNKVPLISIAKDNRIHYDLSKNQFLNIYYDNISTEVAYDVSIHYDGEIVLKSLFLAPSQRLESNLFVKGKKDYKIKIYYTDIKGNTFEDEFVIQLRTNRGVTTHVELVDRIYGIATKKEHKIIEQDLRQCN